LSAFAVAFLSSTIWGGAQASAGEFSKLRSDLDGMSAVKLAADIVTSAPACASPSGELVCDRTTGQWLFALKANPSFSANTIKIVGTAPGVSVANGPLLPLGNPVTTLQLSGAFQGKSVAIDMCPLRQAGDGERSAFRLLQDNRCRRSASAGLREEVRILR
jgi:hypothetical protein